ncbi:DUF1365 domain-containing protein [Thalassovita mediterranea]|jgi:DUF1365 family protein|uniref:Cyclopropane-fatty-acyl-phospholipid synthase n=1 Tax=Thalassovita mediterranea TaxID=340021 RepID=A0A0P1H642_9RHOB|nr:DUF1365 domain-containing protein [Thalassovita mediterranea]CUH85914.1 hypothetical protein TM5383_03157 [Thalassovita mediterranea]SIS32802.1 hypothetical protein SAMN05421685_107108 [Thalassovita mediterranea]
MSDRVTYIPGVTTHTRRGAIKNAFRYSVDYVLLDPEAQLRTPTLFGRNRRALAAVHDRDHGGVIGQGQGAPWARQVLADHGLPADGITLRLLTQPRWLHYGFNPVSFWFAYRDADLVAVIAEVSTPFNDRHSYICHAEGFLPITRETKLNKAKQLHVSPFQEIAGGYDFRYDIREDQIAIQILHRNGEEGLMATLSGPCQPLTNTALIRASLRRPLGGLRTMALIHWQALVLKLKGARYRTRPTPPKQEVS